ncbi:MAG TPA: glycosyltransferase family 9 protein [Trichocoleus sp.]
MRVLALVPGGIDNQILFFPTIKRLHDIIPKAEINVVVEPQAKDAYQLSKLVKEVIPYSFQTRNSPADWANLLGIIRDREFDVAITLSQSWSIGLMLWLSGVPTRIGYAGGANSLFLTRTLPLKRDQYLADQYHDLLAGLDVPGGCPEVSLNVAQSDIAWADKARTQAGLGEQGYVLFYTGPATPFSSSKEPDSYPTEGWAGILKDFQARQPDLPLVLIQTSETFDTIAALNQTVPNLKTLQPETIGQFAALIAGANLFLSTDSYPLYLAVALKVFSLGLFGANHPDRNLPPAQGADTRFLGVVSSTGKVADIPPVTVLKKIWNEA